MVVSWLHGRMSLIHYIVATESDETEELHVIVESQCLLSCNSPIDSIINVMCIYFVCNIEYPKHINYRLRD